MTWKELTLKERSKLYKQVRGLYPDLTYFDIRDLIDNPRISAYANGGVTQEPVEATFGLPEVNIYPQNEFGDIARNQGITTARNWRTVKEGTTKGINDFYKPQYLIGKGNYFEIITNNNLEYKGKFLINNRIDFLNLKDFTFNQI